MGVSKGLGWACLIARNSLCGDEEGGEIAGQGGHALVAGNIQEFPEGWRLVVRREDIRIGVAESWKWKDEIRC